MLSIVERCLAFSLKKYVRRGSGKDGNIESRKFEKIL